MHKGLAALKNNNLYFSYSDVHMHINYYTDIINNVLTLEYTFRTLLS